MIETERMMNGDKYQTKIITHTGYRRIVKFQHSDGKKVKDEIKLFKNHAKDGSVSSMGHLIRVFRRDIDSED